MVKGFGLSDDNMTRKNLVGYVKTPNEEKY